ncbi:10430_t:CDS:2, partial [Funneliformis mosseae]
KVSYTSSGSHYDNHNIIPNGIDLKRAESTPHISPNTLSQTSIEKTKNNLDLLNQVVELTSLRRELKVAINGHSNQAEELLLKKSIISPQPEPSGLDILSQVAQDMLGRRIKFNNYYLWDDFKRTDGHILINFYLSGDESIFNQVQEIVESSDFSKESKAHFVLSIQKYALASSKKNLSKKLQPIVDNLQSILTKRINSRLTQQLNFVAPRQK